MKLDDNFEILDTLFQSKSTIIYRAKLLTDNRIVIIKTLNNDFPSNYETAKTKHEYYILKKLINVEGVIKVVDLFESNNTLMMVFENVEGDTLKNIFLNNDQLFKSKNIEMLLKIAISVTNVISNIHLKQIIHKDLSPDNIIYNLNTEEVTVIDFGISSQLTFEQHSFLNHNELEGKLDYISPEQTGRINKVLDYRSDLYSWGVTLYELFTGQCPFYDCDGLELIHAHIAKPAKPVHEINANIPKSLSDIIMRLLAKMADERYQTAKGLSYDLTLCLDNLHKCDNNLVLGTFDRPPKLQIKQKLYGREKEIELLLNAYERVSLGKSEFILLAGASGTGKTVLAQEVYKPLTQNKGLFISGKFDQNQYDMPFYAWTQVFSSLTEYLLKEDDISLARWRKLIQKAIGNNGQVLIDAIPSLELIIGKQTLEPTLSGAQAVNRFNYIIKQFIKSIASPEHPLVIFLDDWQWADTVSIDLLKYLISDNNHEYILFICGYRNEGIVKNHPFSLALDVIDNSSIQSELIHLNNLNQKDTSHLISDALQHPDGIEELSTLIYRKTRGNAFFLGQFLLMLENKKLLKFDLQSSQWTWRIKEIESLNITNNVIELMVEKIKLLSVENQSVIQISSCLGNKFTVEELAILLNVSTEEAINQIYLPLKEGIFTVKKNTYYFIHDRVQQAAYSILDNAEKITLHHRIALSLFSTLSKDEIHNKIFDIVHHFNKAATNITTDEENSLLIKLNFQAGNKARKATAYELAFMYYNTAMNVLTKQCWHERYWAEHYELTIILYIRSAEIAFYLRKYEQMEQWINKVLLQAQTPNEKAQVWTIRLQAYTAQNRLSDAVDASLFALQILDVNLPKNPTDFQVLLGLLKTKIRLKGHTPNDLLSLPEMIDDKQLQVMNILGLTIPAAYWTSPNLVAMIIFKLTQTSVLKGYAPISGYAFSWWGITECAMLGNIDSGDEFGKLGIMIAQKHNLYTQQPLFFSGWMINNYKNALKDSLPILDKAYTLSLDKGDLEYASYALNNKIQHKFHIGESLPLLLVSMHDANKKLQRFEMASSIYWHNICWQLTLNLSEQEQASSTLSGIVYNETDMLPLHFKVNDASTLFFLYFAKLMQSYIFQDIKKSVENLNDISPYLKAGLGTYQHRLFYFYQSLTLLADLKNNSKQAQFSHLVSIRSNLKKFRKWAKYAPMNHLQHLHLIEAEYMRVIGKPEKAMIHYDLAIEWSNKNGFIHEEAIAYELASRFYIATNRQRFASHDLIQAHYLYTKWGAQGKAIQLVKCYSKQFPRILSYNKSVDKSLSHTHSVENSTAISKQYGSVNSVSINNLSSQIDLQTIIKSSQLIAGEIVFDELIKSLSIFIIENSGAQRFVLLTLEDEKFSSTYESQLIQGEVVTQIFEEEYLVENSINLPSSLIHYVHRTHQSTNLTNDNIFAQDKYFKDDKVKSVFCSPIVLHGKVTGIIYLENKLLSDVFTPERVELIQLLSSQAAISIENSKLYGDLEKKVEDRTRQLESANKDLTRLATIDSLTQLANRHLFNERMLLEVGRAKRQQLPISILLCDIDNFKEYNDNYGHVEGDECLQKVGVTFSSIFGRKTDLPARYGGEEFAVILPGVVAEEALTLAQKICNSIKALNITHEHNSNFGFVTISVGCHSIIPNIEENDNLQIRTLLLQVDQALYQAKERGRNQVVQWGRT